MEKEVKIEPKIEETKEYLTEMVPSMYMLTEKPYVQVLLDKLCQYNSCELWTEYDLLHSKINEILLRRWSC